MRVDLNADVAESFGTWSLGEDEALIVELMSAETYLCFGPDTLAEARNRGYHLFRKQRALHDA